MTQEKMDDLLAMWKRGGYPALAGYLEGLIENIRIALEGDYNSADVEMIRNMIADANAFIEQTKTTPTISATNYFLQQLNAIEDLDDSEPYTVEAVED